MRVARGWRYNRRDYDGWRASRAESTKSLICGIDDCDLVRLFRRNFGLFCTGLLPMPDMSCNIYIHGKTRRNQKLTFPGRDRTWNHRVGSRIV